MIRKQFLTSTIDKKVQLKNNVFLNTTVLNGKLKIYAKLTNPKNENILYSIIEPEDSVLIENIGMNSVYRNKLYTAFNDLVLVEELNKNTIPLLKKIIVNIRSQSKKKYSDASLLHIIHESPYFNEILVNLNQDLILKIKDENDIVDIIYIHLDHLLDEKEEEFEYGLFEKGKTEIIFTGENVKTEKLFKISDLSFEKIGVGGLDFQFEEIFRRAFLSHMIPKKLHDKLGVQHTKGILLYGPAGCGKTRLARSISQILNIKSVKIVNGPEVLSKYVGESEENVRKLFAEAEANPDELHMIIFDEFDAICKQRGLSNSNSGVNDSLVNQLLSKIDGVNALNNIIMVGMTNRKDLIDEAIIRPGRFEVHIEIGLPDFEGRKQILILHTKKLRDNNILDDTINFDELAEKTENMTGAELESLVKNTVSLCIKEFVNMNDIENSLKQDMNVKIGQDKFLIELSKMKPMYGLNQDVIGKILQDNEYQERNPKIMKSMIDYIMNYKENGKVLNNILIHGSSQCGKTYTACYLASLAKFKFTRYICANDLLNYSEIEKINYLIKIFRDAMNTDESFIIIDDVDILIEYTPPHHFSNKMIQTLKTFMGTKIFEKKMMVVYLTNQYEDILSKRLFDRIHETYCLDLDNNAFDVNNPF